MHSPPQQNFHNFASLFPCFVSHREKLTAPQQIPQNRNQTQWRRRRRPQQPHRNLQTHARKTISTQRTHLLWHKPLTDHIINHSSHIVKRALVLGIQPLSSHRRFNGDDDAEAKNFAVKTQIVTTIVSVTRKSVSLLTRGGMQAGD